jgi:hypothetical protein
MNFDEDQPIYPLTRALLPTLPWFLKWSGWMNNQRNESAVDALLATRSKSAVMDAWGATLPDADFVERILAAIGKEMRWENPCFIPQDECFVVMKLWWHGVADCWERERCMWAIEAIFRNRPSMSILPTVPDMALGELLVHFQGNRGQPPSGES